ncbi:MAG: hypothetical protein ABEJ08_04415 [Halobacteriaceae archaeon]
MEWRQVEGGLGAVGHAGATLTVHAPDWRPLSGADAGAIPGVVDAVVAGETTALSVPAGVAWVRRLDGPTDRPELRPGADRDLGAGQWVLRASASADLAARFPGPATVRWPEDGRVAVSVPGPTRFTLAARDRARTPAETLTVSPTPDAVARAVTRAGRTPLTTGPARSGPWMRPHPPRIDLTPSNGGLAVERGPVAEAATDVAVSVPGRLSAVYAAAPLAYYLGADLVIRPGPPRLVAPAAGVDRSLDPVASSVASILPRVVWLDCLLRDAPPSGPVTADRLDALGADPGLAGAPVGERLAAALAAPEDAVDAVFPEWPLAVYVEPTIDRAPALSALLDGPSLVFPPETDDLSGKRRIERSLSEFYRAGPPGDVRSPELVRPVLQAADLHGWIAPDVPVDVFRASTAAYEHRWQRNDDASPLSVALVLNDPSMAGERVDAAAAYRERAAARPVDVTVHECLSRSELARVVEGGTDLLHFIGHCEVDGLRCTDGTLAVDDLDAPAVETFFLNACGSHHEGECLIETGAVAGAVTYREVLDAQAAQVGAAFAGLIVRGFSFERAVGIARRRILMGTDYAVLGDGTHAVAESPRGSPMLVRVEDCADGPARFEVTVESPHERETGGCYRPPFGGASTRLCGEDAVRRLDRDEVASLCAGVEAPVVYDGEFCWSDEVAGLL